MKAIIRDLKNKEYVLSVSKEVMTGEINYETTDDFECAALVDTETTDLRKIEKLCNLKQGRLEFDTDLVKYYQIKTQDEFLQKVRDVIDTYVSKLENYDDKEAIMKLIETIMDEIEKDYEVDLSADEIEKIVEQNLNDQID